MYLNHGPDHVSDPREVGNAHRLVLHCGLQGIDFPLVIVDSLGRRCQLVGDSDDLPVFVGQKLSDVRQEASVMQLTRVQCLLVTRHCGINSFLAPVKSGLFIVSLIFLQMRKFTSVPAPP